MLKTEVPEPTQLSESLSSYLWRIENKYYTADIQLCSCSVSSLPSGCEFATNVNFQSVIIVFDQKQVSLLFYCIILFNYYHLTVGPPWSYWAVPCKGHVKEFVDIQNSSRVSLKTEFIKFFTITLISWSLILACSRHLDCAEQRKAARSARVGAREDWERDEEMPVKLILKSSCRPLWTTHSSKETWTQGQVKENKKVM